MLRFVNTIDKTNDQAEYVGAAACAACHSEIASWHAQHGHSAMLTRLTGGPPDGGTDRSASEPPAGLDWPELSYIVGGFARHALFVDRDGFLLTGGASASAVQWNLGNAAIGSPRGYSASAYSDGLSERQPYDRDCFGCHTTGSRTFDPAAPQFQDGRPGIPGGWHEAGIQCEACHGPGGNHFFTAGGTPQIERRAIFVDPSGAQTCATCHNGPFGNDSPVIDAAGGYIAEYEQWSELRASGGHAGFSCTICHDPHRSLHADRALAIRNECRACHRADEVTMAGHGGKVFRRGDYVETLSCESCHMPFAGRSGASAGPEVVGPLGRMGDVRTHIFRINTDPVDQTAFFSADGRQVRRDAEGRAAVTVDFVCLRCHNGLGNVFELSVARAAEIAGQIHDLP